MKTLIQLVVVALLGHAAYQVGTQCLTYYTFQDAVHEAVRFGPRDEGALRMKVMDMAAGYAVPLKESDLAIARTDKTVHVEVQYDTAIEVLPRYSREWRFAWVFDVEQVGGRIR